MKQITVNITNDKFPVFKAFIESLEYAKIIDEKEDRKKKKKNDILKGIETGMKEVELIRKGELKGTPLKDVLNDF